jgi:hypothetical protein
VAAKEDPTSKAVVRKNTAAEYGWSITLMNSDPELKKLFNSAVTNTWEPARFQAELKNTKWFKKHSETARAALIAKTVDPGTWKATIESNSKALKDHAASLGAVLSDKQLAKIVSDTTLLGWNPAQQQDAMAKYVTVATAGPNKGQYIGAAGQNAQALRATAENNGYTISDKDLGKWTKAIAAGDSTVDDYQHFMRRQAALSFPSFADELYAGADMKDIANPYINKMAQTLELDPDSINLQDPTISKALASKDPKTGKPTAMAMYDFENSLRSDARWQKTDNAKQAAATTVLGIGRIMGLQ